jgi:hypothetical protein
VKRDRFLEATATVTLIDMLLADPNLSASFKTALNADYTPEELAIEAAERAQADEQQERLDRQEREATRQYDRTRGEL